MSGANSVGLSRGVVWSGGYVRERGSTVAAVAAVTAVCFGVCVCRVSCVCVCVYVCVRARVCKSKRTNGIVAWILRKTPTTFEVEPPISAAACHAANSAAVVTSMNAFGPRSAAFVGLQKQSWLS